MKMTRTGLALAFAMSTLGSSGLMATTAEGAGAIIVNHTKKIMHIFVEQLGTAECPDGLQLDPGTSTQAFQWVDHLRYQVYAHNVGEDVSRATKVYDSACGRWAGEKLIVFYEDEVNGRVEAHEKAVYAAAIGDPEFGNLGSTNNYWRGVIPSPLPRPAGICPTCH